MSQKRLIEIVNMLKRNGIDPQDASFWDLYRNAPAGRDEHNAVSWAMNKFQRHKMTVDAQRHRQKNQELLNNLGGGDMDQKQLWNDIRTQVRHTGLNPDDPDFIRFAQRAPQDRPLFDQISWALNKTRKAKELHRPQPQRQRQPEPVTLEDALESSAVKF
jgi:hypothetical protein